jgi:Cadherin-like domain
VQYAPNSNFNGQDRFPYTVSDANGGPATSAVSVTVTAGNDTTGFRRFSFTIPTTGMSTLGIRVVDVGEEVELSSLLIDNLSHTPASS